MNFKELIKLTKQTLKFQYSDEDKKKQLDKVCKLYSLQTSTFKEWFQKNQNNLIWNEQTQGYNSSDNVYISDLKLTIIPIQFNKVDRGFYCYNNKLKNLEGSPKEVGGDFDCHGNQLTNLESSPEKVDGSFNCNYNQLINLKGSPSKVGGDFYCDYNKLRSLEGSPKEVGGNFYCHHNITDFTEEQVKAVCKVKGKIYIYEL